jgi:rare lipoprotein A
MLDQASWYGSWHHGKTTANGEVFDMFALTAAHKRLPFGTLVRVTDIDSGRAVVVRINDRGPYWAGRSLDLSFGAAEELGIIDQGHASVRLEVIGRETRAAHVPALDAAPDRIG